MDLDVAPEIPIERFEIFANGLDHPECLAFDRDGSLWAGGEAGQVYRISQAGVLETVAEMGGFCAGVAWTPDDAELFVCNPKRGIVRVRRSGEWSVFAGAAGAQPLICPNYGVFDRYGNYLVTDSGNWKKHNGWLLRYRSDGTGEVLAGPFGYANGLALSADERYLFMVESDTDSVHRIDLSTGAASVYAGHVGRLPDGLALAADGDLFASCYASDDIYRINAAGMVTRYAYDRWAILLSRPTNMAFRDGYLYAANLGRTTITRAQVGRAGKPLANER
ncbi:MAG TPA: SMP-30/gluconolactonase/LRE family protein [Bryobacteraceae bacterium]|nr:SMP-30/gluconolactonase/LRE family protein [Bryobacteraceae bacterium]